MAKVEAQSKVGPVFIAATDDLGNDYLLSTNIVERIGRTADGRAEIYVANAATVGRGEILHADKPFHDLVECLRVI